MRALYQNERMAIDLLRRLGLMIILVVVQALLLNRIHLFGCATPLLYVYFVLLFPASMPRWLSLPLAFVLGIAIDSFTNTPGVASFSLTLTAFAQSYLLRLYLDKDDNEDLSPSIHTMGWLKYFSYAFCLTLLFCLTYFSVEAFSFYHWLHWLMSTLGSWVLTLILILTLNSTRNS